MRKLLAVVLMSALVLGLAAAPSLGGKKKKKPQPQPVLIEASGTISGANPAGQYLFGVTEGEFVHANACSSMPKSQGVDGFVVEIPEDFSMKGGTVELKGSSAAPHDLAIYYYDFGCALMNDWSLNDGSDEAGAVPPGARWIVIDQLTGANTAFTLNATSNI